MTPSHYDIVKILLSNGMVEEEAQALAEGIIRPGERDGILTDVKNMLDEREKHYREIFATGIELRDIKISTLKWAATIMLAITGMGVTATLGVLRFLPH